MREVNASIITIGDELLIGQTIDTNSAFIGQELNRIGIWVSKRVAIGDSKKDILKVLEEEGKNNDVVIITGGLGPTADDITKPTLCEYFNTRLVMNEAALENVKDIFTKLNRPLIERNLKQAEVPEACVVLQNKRGTAPGMWFGPHPSLLQSLDTAQKQTIYISLPGVPHEMKGLITGTVIPALEQLPGLPAIVHRTLLTSGIGESMLAEHISDFENALPGEVKLAYLPSYGLVRLRLTCRHENKAIAEETVTKEFEKLKLLVKKWKVADENTALEKAVNDLLRSRKKTLGTAESCTGGYIAHLITSVSGSSEVFKGSVISYANELKEELLGVKGSTLRKFGAVSEETVREMVAGGLNQLKTDYLVATSGIMGPGGGSDEKPVGTVWIAVGNKEKTITLKSFFRYERERNIEMTAHAALSLLYRFITAGEGNE